MALPVSLIVPLRNEEASAASLVESVWRQTQAPDELIVIDAGSTDRTAEVVESFASRGRVRLVRAGPLYPGLARNAGVAAAAQPWLAFTDGGIRIAPGWLRALADTAEQETADVVFGTFEPVCDTTFRRAAAIAYVPGRNANGLRGPSVASMLLTREAFERSGGFPPFRAAEDLIFLERLLGSPVRVAYAPDAVAYWEIAPDVRSTFRRFALYSEHNLRAGRGRFWHAGVLRHYLAMTVLAAGVGMAGSTAWSILVWPFWQAARALRSAWIKRGAFDFETLDPRHLLGAAALLSVIDAATLAGAIRWARLGFPRTA